jgi:hypothetical protein
MDADQKTIEERKLLLEEWKTVIQTQMHFNDMIMKMRTTGVTIVLAFFGAASISLQYPQIYLSLYGLDFHASILIIISGLVLLTGVFCLDYFYYFKMLIGAVERGYEIDDAYQKEIVAGTRMFGMSRKIQKAIGSAHMSKYYIWIFYGLVFVFGIVFIIGIFYGYHPSLLTTG